MQTSVLIEVLSLILRVTVSVTIFNYIEQLGICDITIIRRTMTAYVVTDVKTYLVQPCGKEHSVIELVDLFEYKNIDLLYSVLSEISITQVTEGIVIDLLICKSV